MKEIVIITGQDGALGQAVCKAMDDLYEVLSVPEEVLCPAPAAKACPQDEREHTESLAHWLAENCGHHGDSIASVVHMADYYDLSGESSPLYETVNVRTTRNLLHALKKFQVGQFILNGSMLVHAPCRPGERITESWPLHAGWPYPQSRLAAEQVVRDHRGAIPAVLLRSAWIYDDRCHLPLLARQIQRIYERWLLGGVFPGNSAHGQAVVHADALAALIVLLVQKRADLPAVLPLLAGEADTLSYEELQSRLGRLIHNEDWETREIPKAQARTGDWINGPVPVHEQPFVAPAMIDMADQHYALDSGCARSLSGWQPRRSLRDTLPEIIKALKRDPLLWYRENGLEAPVWLRETGGLRDRRRADKRRAPS